MMESLWLALAMVGRADPELFRVVGLSLRVSGTACLLGAVMGLALGTWLAAARFRGLALVVWALNTLLALPSVVVGLLVYLLLSRAGPLGSWGILFTPGAMVVAQAILITPIIAALARQTVSDAWAEYREQLTSLGALGILFTPAAMVIAQTILVVPLIAALSRRLVLDALSEGGDQLRSLGASPRMAAALMLLHERRSVLTVLLTAFGRAIAEVGAVMIVGGNIDGLTRVMTTAIALETSKGDLPLALALGVVLLGVVGLLNLLIGALQSRGGALGSPREALA